MIALNDITNHQINLELNYEIRIEEVLDIFLMLVIYKKS